MQMVFYYLEMITTFIILSMLGLLFLPFFGGCLGLIIFVFVLGAILVFSSLHFIWLVMVALILYLVNIINKFIKWRKLPTSSAYLNLHPNCRIKEGIACFNCNSSELKNYGLFHARSKWRFYTCTQCGSSLFRFTVL
jgi:hypothetical protein